MGLIGCGRSFVRVGVVVVTAEASVVGACSDESCSENMHTMWGATLWWLVILLSEPTMLIFDRRISTAKQWKVKTYIR